MEEKYPELTFRHRNGVLKSEINKSLQKLDSELDQTLFLENSSIRPDGGIIEVKDDKDHWRVVLVSEAKFQGKDIETLKTGFWSGKITIKT